ncbi:MAG: hypothetical protein J7L03_06665 [Caldisericaceae bacterium]|nr:hypothetical protein [Caldisericaceae bacterium]
MQEEIKKVLELLEEGKITKEEAVELIKAIKSSDISGEKIDESKISNGKRTFRVLVTKDGKKEVEVNIPFGIVKFGLAIAKKMGKNSLDINGKEIPIDIDKLSEVLKDPNFKGKIVDISDKEDNEHVEVEIV